MGQLGAGAAGGSSCLFGCLTACGLLGFESQT